MMIKVNIFLLFLWTALFFTNCSHKEKNKIIEKDYLSLDYDTLDTNQMIRFFEMKVDSFENDTTFISEKFILKSVKENIKPATIYLDYSPNYQNASLHILLNKGIFEDYCEANFKFPDSKIVRLLSRVINVDNLTLLDYWINEKEKYLTLKNICVNDTILFRAGTYDDTEMIITKNQLKGLEMFLLFMEQKGLFKK